MRESHAKEVGRKGKKVIRLRRNNVNRWNQKTQTQSELESERMKNPGWKEVPPDEKKQEQESEQQ